MAINRKIALKAATAGWCSGLYARLRGIRSGFDAGLGFILFTILIDISISGWVE